MFRILLESFIALVVEETARRVIPKLLRAAWFCILCFATWELLDTYAPSVAFRTYVMAEHKNAIPLSYLVVMVAGALLAWFYWWSIGIGLGKLKDHVANPPEAPPPTSLPTTKKPPAPQPSKPASEPKRPVVHKSIKPVEPALSITQADRQSTDPDAPFEIQVVITTRVEIPKLESVRVNFDGEISAWSWTSPPEAGRNTIKQAASGKGFMFPYANLKYGLTPKFDPASPLVFLVWSKQPIKCLGAETF